MGLSFRTKFMILVFGLIYLLFIFNDGHYIGLVSDVINAYIDMRIQEFIDGLFATGVPTESQFVPFIE